ncbi:MAG: hypothetical protein LLG93_12040 [Deltaproteobacteria bacterium]|nr:hypothetical protein [Deltaproteobacteria bacterium]
MDDPMKPWENPAAFLFAEKATSSEAPDLFSTLIAFRSVAGKRTRAFRALEQVFRRVLRFARRVPEKVSDSPRLKWPFPEVVMDDRKKAFQGHRKKGGT